MGLQWISLTREAHDGTGHTQKLPRGGEGGKPRQAILKALTHAHPDVSAHPVHTHTHTSDNAAEERIAVYIRLCWARNFFVYVSPHTSFANAIGSVAKICKETTPREFR